MFRILTPSWVSLVVDSISRSVSEDSRINGSLSSIRELQRFWHAFKRFTFKRTSTGTQCMVSTWYQIRRSQHSSCALGNSLFPISYIRLVQACTNDYFLAFIAVDSRNSLVVNSNNSALCSSELDILGSHLLGLFTSNL